MITSKRVFVDSAGVEHNTAESAVNNEMLRLIYQTLHPHFAENAVEGIVELIEDDPNMFDRIVQIREVCRKYGAKALEEQGDNFDLKVFLENHPRIPSV